MHAAAQTSYRLIGHQSNGNTGQATEVMGAALSGPVLLERPDQQHPYK